MKKFLSIFIAGAMMLSMFGCTAKNTPTEKPTDPSKTDSSQETKKDEVKPTTELPVINISWGNEMHTGIMYLPFIASELFEKNAVHVKPLSDSQGELISDGKAIAVLNRVITKGGSECATLMGQNHLDVAFTSSTAMMTAYDVGADVQILSPIQCDGVAIAATKDSSYNTFQEFVDYAKKSEQPIKAGYHSAISSPRIVLESACKDAGLVVTEDPSNLEADVLMVDLKGVQNLVPSLSSKQVEVWAGPAPHPQNAESAGVGKIISTLNQIPGGKWSEFPCCCYAARGELIKSNPDILQAIGQVAHDAAEYANNNQEKTGEYLSEIVGVDKDILPKSLIVYSTVPNDKYINGIGLYYNAMKDMGKFTGKLMENEYEEAKKVLFNFDIIEKVNNK